MLEWLKDRDHLENIQKKHRDYFVLMFWGSFSDAAKRALKEIKEFAKDYKNMPVYVMDVTKIKGVHKEHNVSNVPTVIAFKKGKEFTRVEGVESAGFYAVRLGGAAPVHIAKPTKQKKLRVTVYSGPGCPACGQAKTYLRKNNIPFREIDISRNQRAAQEITRRSGQQAVPQIDVNGRLVVGLDKSKLAPLLGIQKERS